MKVKRFFAPDMRQAMKLVRDEFGSDAAILSNNKVAGGVEIVTAVDYDSGILRQSSENITEEQPDALTESLADALSKAKSVIDSASDNQDGPIENAFQVKAQQHQTSQRSRAEAMVNTLDKANRRDNVEDVAVRAMQSEIQGLRELLKEQMKESMAERKPVEAMVQKRLRRLGLSEAFAQRILTALSLADNAEFAVAWDKAIEQIQNNILTVSSDIVDQGGIVALVGPTGVGKTTTIGKLAARYVLKHGPENIALVTTDCYRIAAYEQLRTFGRILGVPVRVVDDKHPLESTLRSLKSKALVLIDTAGLSAQDPNMVEQFQLLESASARIKKYIVLSSTSQGQVLQSAYDTYKKQDLNGCVITKLDESVSAGEVLSLVADNRLPLAYVSDGQKIPDDLRAGDARYLVYQALELLEKLEASRITD